MVRMRYHYTDGHTFVTEVMTRQEALAYLPALKATATTPNRYVTHWATIIIEEV